MDNGNIGSGIAFPFSLDKYGNVVMNGEQDRIRQSIRLILQTAKEERAMRYDFGSGLKGMVFAALHSGNIALVIHEVKDALKRFEPRIEVQDVDVKPDHSNTGLMLINIKYKIKNTGTVDNLTVRSTP